MGWDGMVGYWVGICGTCGFYYVMYGLRGFGFIEGRGSVPLKDGGEVEGNIKNNQAVFPWLGDLKQQVYSTFNPAYLNR